MFAGGFFSVKAISGVLILVMDNRKNSNVGHYVLLMRHPRSGITFFDPYGFGVTELLRMTQNSPHLVMVKCCLL